ncbi:hypothetical protein [Ectobacillus panaciterrae]|uniref:hypothetical protein n=1 Tax=Ectobacillus panaciterrae TaxID=363872 RepID=UPI00040C9456|nr:hypothetical protein [Ectobacillus panaciterrae]
MKIIYVLSWILFITGLVTFLVLGYFINQFWNYIFLLLPLLGMIGFAVVFFFELKKDLSAKKQK